MKDNQFGIMPYEVMASTELSTSAKVVYTCLCMLHNKSKGYCWPSNHTISVSTNISEKTVKACLKELEEHGFITRETSYKDEGFMKTRKIYIK